MTTIKEGEPEAIIPLAEIPTSARARAPLPEKIRMLISLANATKAWTAGQIYTVGVDVPPESAESWLRNGVAVEAREEGGPTELKEK